jgi:hypothetical protein
MYLFCTKAIFHAGLLKHTVRKLIRLTYVCQGCQMVYYQTKNGPRFGTLCREKSGNPDICSAGMEATSKPS